MEKPTFIILGATGDLTKRKLLPAIYHLIKKQKLKNFAVIGAARSQTSMKTLINSAKKFVPNSNQTIWNKILSRSEYVRLDFKNPKDYKKLKSECLKIENSLSLPKKRIIYLATLPNFFPTITKNLNNTGLSSRSASFPRLVFEKPFGSDLASAKKINKTIHKYFNEKQIYRIDHYLGKELVANIDLVRFTNRILEPLWSHEHIENVQISLEEKIGVGSRGGFYDKYGALKDMVQNHMLQLVSLIAMESPQKLQGDFVRNKKVELLKKITIQDLLLGQYQGYRSENDVAKNSNTPTFAALKLNINTPRWKNVPFFLKTGKALNQTKAVIYLKFKKVDCLLNHMCPTDTNYLIINLKTNEGMALELFTKIPGKTEIEPSKLEFRIKNKFGPNTPEAYENLLEEIIHGNQYVFVRNDAIEHSWRALQPWLNKKIKIHPYKKGTEGPKALEAWSNKNKVKWRS